MTDLGNAFPVPESKAEPEKGAELPNLEKLEATVADEALPAAEAEITPKPESKVRRFFRTLLRWTLGVLIVFGAGFIAAIFLLYNPEKAGLEAQQIASQAQQAELQTQLDTAKGEIADLEAQVSGLNPLATENNTLLASQAEYELHILTLDSRLDVTGALLALAENDTARAQVILDRTGDKLTAMKEMLPATQSGMVAGMAQRLELIMSEIADDPYAAQSDLDVLSNSLLELENALFGTP